MAIRDEDKGKHGFNLHPENINKKGRPKKIYTVLKETGYSKDDIRTVFGELPFYTLDELKEIHMDETKPVIARIVANQLFLALKKGDYTKIREILQLTLQSTENANGVHKVEVEIVHKEASDEAEDASDTTI